MEMEELRRRFGGRAPGPAGAHFRCAVLCPLVERDGAWELLFEVRASALRRQPGEICFPGGRMEPGEDAVACALRETEEELQIPRGCVEVLGPLDFLFQPSGVFIQPVLGRIPPEGFSALVPSADEVAEVFTVPVSFFAETPPALYHYDLLPEPQPDFPYADIGFPGGYAWRGGRSEVPVWHWGGRVIWGLTGRILQNLLELLDPKG